MKKIVLLPLDERPCNYEFPHQIFNSELMSIVRPPLSILGDKKKPGDLDAIRDFLIEETKDADGLVISIDTLLYGGIVPSRLHYDTTETLTERLHLLKTLKEENPKLKIYGFHLIMRCPQYSSDDEEPDYYADWGREIFLTGFLKHKIELQLATPQEIKEFEELKVDESALNDYLNRRTINTVMCMESIQLADEGIIDFLIIPQDDAAEFGWTAKDQVKVRQLIEERNLQLDVYMYPGADEVANTLLSRMLCHFEQKRPLFYIHYPSATTGQLIPRYEDRMLDTTVKYQILAAGGLVASSISEADIVLFVNAPSAEMAEAAYQHVKSREYTTQRNLVEFIEQIDYCVNHLNKPVVISDVAFSNGGDIELVKLLGKKNLLMKVAAYAGWNTSSNTLGTAIPHGVMYWLTGDTETHRSFLASRYVEDVGYCSVIRKQVSETKLEALNYNYFYVEESHGIVADIVKEELNQFVNNYLPSIASHIQIDEVYMPWRRMFEIGVKVTYQSEGLQ